MRTGVAAWQTWASVGKEVARPGNLGRVPGKVWASSWKGSATLGRVPARSARPWASVAKEVARRGNPWAKARACVCKIVERVGNLGHGVVSRKKTPVGGILEIARIAL